MTDSNLTFNQEEDNDEVIQESIQPVTPTEIVQNQFRSPFGGRIGKSSIDLSKDNNEDIMLDEYQNWWHHGLNFGRVDPEKVEERNNLKESFHQKYYGMSSDEYNAERYKIFREEGGFYPGANNLFANLDRTFQALSTAGLGYMDFFMDAAGTIIPGFNSIDERWDKATMLDNPIHQQMRDILSIVLPSIHLGQFSTAQITAKANHLPWLQKALLQTGTIAAGDAAIIGLSDQGEEHNAFRVLADLLPGQFGPKGRTPFPEGIVTLDSDSPAVRKRKNMFFDAGLSAFASTIGAFIEIMSAKPKMSWFEPLDDASSKYKQLELEAVTESVEPDKLIRLQQIDELLSSGQLSKQNENILINEKLNLEDTLGVIDDVDKAAKLDIDYRAKEIEAAQIRKGDQLELDFDADFYPASVEESAIARNVPTTGNTARNMADTTAIKRGVSEGDPAPIITEAMRTKGLMVGPKSRDAIMGVAEETRDIGRFDAIVDGFRFSNKQMNAAAWDIYTSIVDPGASLDDVRALFLENRDVKNLLLGRFKVEHINEEQARAAAFAMRDLVDRFLGREVSEASARAMDTLGRESATLAQSIKEMAPYIDDDRAMDLIIDKMEFLMDEYALNKYISGWQLRNKNWFDQVPPKELDTVIDQLTKEFTDAENAIHARNMRFTKTLKELKVNNPAAMKPLVDAYAHTNGDVDTLAKLYKWAAEQITPMGMIKSPDPKQLNLFARAMWGVRYNNVLSGLSAARAMVGNSWQLITRPITAILGHSFWGITDNFEEVRRAIYYNSAIFETNRRALQDAFSMMKKVHKNPEDMMKAFRKDFVFQGERAWDIMEEMRPVWEEQGNWGRILQYDLAKTLKDLSNNKALRYGMTALTFPDAYTNTHMAHWLSRVRAYDDVFSELGYFKKSAVLTAEAEHYGRMFDENGLIKDQALKAISGEISLNLDDGVSKFLNKATTAYPILKDQLMFPRTSSNWIRNSLSWTPVSLIPGINKYSKTLYAKNQDEIAAALAEHGIDMATSPNAMAIFKQLRAEYTGRIAFSSLLVGSLYQYAMGGNIRGNGHYNASRRKKERDQMGYEPKTINIDGKWVSYEGLIGVEQILSIIGDFSYYASDLDESLLQNWRSKLTWTIAAAFLNDSPFEGLEPLIAGMNGDLTGWNRIIANSARSYLPLSGGAGVLASAIDSAQKDLQGEVHEYLRNRLPGFNHDLPNQIDIWTGDPLNDIQNPVLKVLNALSPIKVSGTNEPWRQWLLETGWDGLGRIRKDSTGSYEYSAEEREIIYKFIGDQKLYKKLERLMNNKSYKKDIEQIRQLRRSNNVDRDSIQLNTKDLPLFKELDRIISDAQKIAESKLAILAKEQPELYGHIPNAILYNQLAKGAMSTGNVPAAINYQRKEQEKRKLIQYGGSR